MWSYETLKKHNNRVHKHVLPHIGERVAHELTERDLELVLLAIQEHGTLVNRNKVKTLFNGLFDWIRYHAVDSEGNPLMARNIALGIAKAPFIEHTPQPFKHASNNRELKEIVNQIELMQASYEVKQAIKLAMLLFLRPVNIVSMEWKQVDFEERVVTYTAEQMKMKAAFTTPIPEQAMNLLLEMQAITGHSDFVFLSPYGSAGKHINRDALSGALRRNGIEVNPHGFRHTASTYLNEAGFDADEIEAQLSHSIGGVRGVYNGAKYIERRRELLQKWADYLDEQKIG